MWSWQAWSDHSRPVQSVTGMDINRFLIFRSRIQGADALVPHCEHQNMYITSKVKTVWLDLRSSEVCLGISLICYSETWGIMGSPLRLSPQILYFSSLQYYASICFGNWFLGYFADIVQHYWSHGPSQLLYHHDGCSFSKISSVAVIFVCIFRAPSSVTWGSWPSRIHSSRCSSLTQFLLRYLPPDLLRISSRR